MNAVHNANVDTPTPWTCLYLLVPPNEQREMLRAAREQAAEAEDAEQRNVQDRVEGWIKQVDAA